MFLSSLRNRTQSQDGFTLIELLVVILIIGILSAIAIPNFLGQTKKAQDTSAKSDVRNAIAAMESCFTDQQTYATCLNTTLSASGLKTPAGTTVSASSGITKGQISVVGAPTTTSYTLTARSQSDNTFTLTNASGVATYSCTGTTGGCPSGGTWG